MTSLIIYGLGSGYTDTHTHTHTRIYFGGIKVISRNQAHMQPARAWFNGHSPHIGAKSTVEAADHVLSILCLPQAIDCGGDLVNALRSRLPCGAICSSLF